MVVGKFEGNTDSTLAEKLYDITLDGGCAEELGEAEYFGWYGLIVQPLLGSFIVSEDSQGFFSYTHYASSEEARNVWAQLEAEYQEFEDNIED